MLSSTVTVELHVLTLPLLSVTVKLTVFSQMFEQSKELVESVMLAMPQSSKELLLMSFEAKIACPLVPSFRIKFFVKTVGGV